MLEWLLKPGAPDRVRGRPSRSPAAVELVLMVQPRELDGAALTSLLVPDLRRAADDPALWERVKSDVADLVRRYPDDISAHTMAALVADLDGDADALAVAAGRLEELAAAQPLEGLAEGKRPNARQRAAAFRRLPLWLAARACWRYDQSRAQGDRLVPFAREAAARQTDPTWTLAMIREWGAEALDRGDRAAAEARWAQMLDLVLAGPARPSGANAGPAAVTNATQAGPAAARIEPQRGSRTRQGPPVPTLERFEQAAKVARLAAANRMHGLSLRAVRQALQAGPPVVPLNMHFAASTGTITSPVPPAPALGGYQYGTPVGGESPGLLSAQVVDRLVEVEPLWDQLGAPAADVYAALREAVLPTARPGEVFLYAAPLAPQGAGQAPVRPRSVGALLARWAARAGQAEDLRRRLEERRPEAAARTPAETLLALLAAAEGKPEALRSALDAIRARLQDDTLQTSAELACHAALPALNDPNPAPADAAAALLDRVVQNLRRSPIQGAEPVGSLIRTLARYLLEHGRIAEGRKVLQDYTAALEPLWARYSGDYPLYLRKQALAVIFSEYVRAGLWADALAVLGDFADAPDYRGASPVVSGSLAALARRLAGVPAAERYPRLRDWTMPTPGRKSLRLLVSFAPVDEPPAAFGVEPMPESWAAGLASSAGLLIDAAREAGQLDALAELVRPMADQDVENAKPLLILIEQARGRGGAVERLARDVSAAIRGKLPPQAETEADSRASPAAGLQTIDRTDILIAQTCLGDAALAPLGEAMVRDLITHARRIRSPLYEAYLYRTRAAAQAARDGIAPGQDRDPGLASWHPADPPEPGGSDDGRVGPWWTAHAGDVRSMSGPTGNLLYFAYPLAGSFTFSVDATNSGWAEGHVSFGGLVFEAMAPPQPEGVFPVGLPSERFSRPSPFLRRGAFNRLTLQVEPGRVRCLVNGHLYYETDRLNGSSPWLALYSSRSSQAVFRNPRIEGYPEIPREVPLIAGDRLDGWECNRYVETRPPYGNSAVGQPEGERASAKGARASTSPAFGSLGVLSVSGVLGSRPQSQGFDWSLDDGVINGRRGGPAAPAGRATDASAGGLFGSEPIPSLLVYERPMRDRESVSYQFYYDPGRTEVHPALGRLAFLLEPGGVRLRWLTADGGTEGSGLRAGNAVAEAEHRRGPARLPLRPKDWNDLRLALGERRVTLELNGVLVYDRPIEATNSRQFSLYHDKRESEARVRRVTLRGDWPESLSPAMRDDLFALRARAAAASADRRARAALIGPEYLCQEAGPLLDRIRKLPDEAQYEALAAWVLPGPDAPWFRLQGEFLASAADDPDTLGARFRAPVLALLERSRRPGKLDDLARRVEGAEAIDDDGRRSRNALNALIALARGDEPGAAALLRAQAELARRIPPDLPAWRRWPELIAASEAVEHAGTRTAGLALLDVLNRQEMKGVGADWLLRIRAARARGEVLNAPDAGRTALGRTPREQPGWFVVTHTTAQSRGEGHPRPRWDIGNGARDLRHRTGHLADAVYLNVPLRGEFEVSAELSYFGSRAAQIVWGGRRPELKGPGPARGITIPQGAGPALWYPYRLVVTRGTATTYVGDREVGETRLPAEPDPCLALYLHGIDNGGARGLTIKGTPEIPDRLRLSVAPDLAGWIADDYDEPLDGPSPMWEKRGEEIHGRSYDPSLAREAAMGASSTPSGGTPSGAGPGFFIGVPGSKHESLLQYHRPMLEDGAIGYEFYYEPGKALVHPALGRLAFILAPEGVATHRRTDGKYERSGLDPGNVAVEPACRRGPGRLPLKEREWNRMELALAGDRVTLRLNGALVYERTLEPTNDRVFGLFHYADETEARVRDVVYRGEWPRLLPEFDRTEKGARSAR